MHPHSALVALVMLPAICTPARAQSADQATANKNDAALARLARSLENGPPGRRLLAIVTVASEGARAHALWPRLAKIVEDGTPVEQVCAVWALGWLAAHEAVPTLTRALGSREWRVVLDATDVLAGFGGDAKPALQALQEVESGHWMAAVREHASVARKSIARAAADNHAGAHEKGSLGWEHELDAFLQGAFRELSGDPCQLASGLAFEAGGTTFEVARDPSGLEATRALAALLPDKVASRAELSGLRAVVAVDDGWLVGTDRGAFGGDLRFVSKRGSGTALWPSAIKSLVKVGNQMLATSVEHDLPGLGTRSVLLVARANTTKHPWVARRLAFLPGKDGVAIPTSNETVLYVTSYGAVSVRTDGSMQEVACPEHAKQAATTGHVERPVHPPTPARPSRIQASSIEHKLPDALAVIDTLINDPRVLPLFHLGDVPDAEARIERLPVDLGASTSTVKAGGHPVQWVEAPAAQDFRFLDMAFETADSATAAFEYRAEGVEGYAVLAKREGRWRVAGLTIVGQ